MKIYLYFFSLLIVLILKGCTSNQKESSTLANDGYEIVATDSITVNNILASLFLFQNANEDHLFFRDAAASKIYVFDRKGQPLHEWTKEGDVPGAFSMIADNLSLTNEGDIVVADKLFGLRVFSPNGDLVIQDRVYQPQMSIHAGVDIFRKNQVIQKNGKTYLLHHLDLMDEVQEVGTEFFQKRRNLLMTDLESRETKKFIPFPDGSKFLFGKAFPFEDFRPLFYYEEQVETLYLIFQNEPILYIYSWKEDEQPILTSSQRLDLDGFHENDGLEYEQVRYGILSANQLEIPFPSSIESLEKIGEVVLIHYKPGPSIGERGDWEKVRKGEADEDLKNTILEKAKERTIALVDGEIISVNLPPMFYNSYRVIGNEIWWMKPTSKDQEDEDFTVFRGKLQPIKSP
ncbi:hypothetical protein [Cecembia lonarensis]|uniref:6-bladed beta-propeller n=1 Tax=Cecembia lonarensis (strain CCUG 58316 / KCTC 22772 / LW9) TaxID=1225176 RepID=K1LAA9_CECL9|nr:hypothetical protein [Cecembia lonarensis]EKB47313.1 hypothetical protein B879_04088 [Cecembia lonarensis LW9]